MYKLIAIDLDGTLLNSYGNVSENNKNAIKKAKSNGIEVVIASGRNTTSCENIANEIGANNYVIAGNGAQIYDIKNQEIIYDKYLDKSKILEIVKLCEENSIYYSIYTENVIIARSLNYTLIFYNNENKKMQEGKKTHISIEEDVYKYIKNSNIDKFLKVTVCDNNKVIFSGIMKKLREIKEINVLEVEHMSRKVIQSGTDDVSIEYFYTEITNKNADKWSAIECLINTLGINPQEVVAIGDNVNDKEMIIGAGLRSCYGKWCTIHKRNGRCCNGK